jgi:hypothetical protein
MKMGTKYSSEKSEDRRLEKLHISAILIYHLQTFIFLMWRGSFVGAIFATAWYIHIKDGNK